MCSEVLTGWNPTKGICMEHSRPRMKNELYATYTRCSSVILSFFSLFLFYAIPAKTNLNGLGNEKTGPLNWPDKKTYMKLLKAVVFF
jgi:hypothetical protein